ncbi:unnamed protein product, partial [Mesorhabditis belari]|uniref:MCM C-terminal AAA(+) ATPase domain-containing protein n=1 Tax=Mesorhabditis belari TaxID=2138241 RepID=A0AAF3EXJ3_9BILA
MEAQEIRSSETRLDVAVLPDVPFLRVLNYLSGLQIEKCRGISRLFQQRIDVNRKSLPTVQVYSLTIDQKKVNPEPLTNNHNEVEPTIFIAIEKDWSRMKYGAAPLRQALERFNHMFPGMSIKTLHLKLEYFDVATFHQLLKKLEECKLEPENFKLAILGETTLLTSSFWQDKCIRDRRGLAISARNLSFDDQVLLNFASPNFMLSYVTACTFAGIASFLNEWGAGIREVTKIRLRVRSDLNIREFFAMLSWNVKFETKLLGILSERSSTYGSNKRRLWNFVLRCWRTTTTTTSIIQTILRSFQKILKYNDAPNDENVELLCNDLKLGLYENFYRNFISPLSRPRPEILATAAVNGGAISQVQKVVDQYLNFISLEDDLFVLKRYSEASPMSYYAINDPSTSDAQMESMIESIADGLFSMCATLGLVPVIRASKDNAAEQIAIRLDQKLRDNLRDARNNLFAFESVRAGQLSSSRPVLIIADRSADLATMLHHTWTDQALVHDVLGLDQNRVSMPDKGKKVDYDLHCGHDRLWTQHKGNAFSLVAEAIQGDLVTFNSCKLCFLLITVDGYSTVEKAEKNGPPQAKPPLTTDSRFNSLNKRSILTDSPIGVVLLNKCIQRAQQHQTPHHRTHLQQQESPHHLQQHQMRDHQIERCHEKWRPRKCGQVMWRGHITGRNPPAFLQKAEISEEESLGAKGAYRFTHWPERVMRQVFWYFGKALANHNTIFAVFPLILVALSLVAPIVYWDKLYVGLPFSTLIQDKDESPDDMPAGQTPHTITIFAHCKLVESVQPGDRVTVTGIYRAQGSKMNPRQRVLNSVYRTNIDALHFRKTEISRLHQNNGENLTDERIAQIKALSKREDIMEILANAIAPSIYEHMDVKKGIICLLFSRTRKEDERTQKTKLRSEINILLCGDPGTAKSQLLQYVFHLLPRSQYTSGKGSLAVGLTASVARDADTKQLVLQTGALVSVLHEVMEQQTLSIAKAGIICQLHARTSILAAANPVDSKWNRDKTIVDNIQLPHTLLSRFDLIFLMVGSTR